MSRLYIVATYINVNSVPVARELFAENGLELFRAAKFGFDGKVPTLIIGVVCTSGVHVSILLSKNIISAGNLLPNDDMSVDDYVKNNWPSWKRAD